MLSGSVAYNSGTDNRREQRIGTVLEVSTSLSHTRTVVRDRFEGDEASQWKRPKFDPSPHQNPLTDLHNIWQICIFVSKR